MNHPDDATPDAPAPSVLRTVVAAVLALALVASLVWLVVEVVDRVDSENADQDARDKVMLATREYMTAAWNFGPGDLEGKELPGYVDRVTPLITTRFKADFDKTVPLLAKQVAEQDYTVSAGVDRLGVESLSADSAQVIVSGEISTVQKKQPTRTEGYLWRVELKRVDGGWRVDNFNAYEAVAAR